MTAATDLPIEERLRAHFADRSAREPIPGPSEDTALERVLSGEGNRLDAVNGTGGPSRTVISLVPRRRVLLVAAAAAVLALAVAAGVVVTNDEPSRVSTDDTPAPTAPPDSSPESGAPSTVPSTTPSTEPSTGGPTPTTPDTTAPPGGGDQPTGLIVSPWGILGSWSGSSWVPWEVGPTPPSGQEYQIVRLADPITTRIGEAGVDCSPAGLPGIDIAWPEDPNEPLAPAPIGVAGVANPRPRPVEVLDPSSAAYQEAAAAVAADYELPAPGPDVMQVVRGDLDGDGSAEVVVTAERLTNGPTSLAEPGDYAMAFLRRMVDGQVQTWVLASSLAEVPPDAPPELQIVVESFRVAAFADLNGDGRMEIVLNSQYFESQSTYVYELRPDGSLPKVLTANCGV
jgi:hypothetical protein